jgi:hypothetical protein
LATIADKQNPALGLRDLPLELRNKIHLYVVGRILTVTIPLGARNFWTLDEQDSWRKDLPIRLPSSLILNQQIRREAMQEVQHSALHIIKKITVANPGDLLVSLPPKTHFSNLSQLNVTQPQQSYNHPTASSVEAVISRCPQLEELTLRVPVAVLLGDYETYFSPLFEAENLKMLNVTCGDAPRDQAAASAGADQPDVSVAQPLERWFLRKGRKTWLWRSTHLSIDLSPDERVDGRTFNRATRGRITYVCEYDPFMR